ncbi:MAG TPA: NBR1-Ig-like domain-containing protein [Myxococcota bacterium]|nr:NBR1-Ig-like domain-containing protein [Myxococcota bacterium]
MIALLLACAQPGTSDGPGHPSRDDLDEEIEDDTGGEDLVDDDAVIRTLSFPSTMTCGEERSALITVQNVGAATWTRAGEYKLGAIGDDDPLVVGDTRSWLPDDASVASGFEYSFEIHLLAPDEPGFVTSDWQMVHENVAWFGESVELDVEILCEEEEEEPEKLPLPDMSHIVDEVAAEHPELLEGSCLDYGGGWGFMDEVVDRLRLVDERWGYNWKRGVVGDPSEDVVDYHWGSGTAEGSEEVYIIDIIVGHCGDGPEPGWLDQTQATADAGTIGLWTGRGRF